MKLPLAFGVAMALVWAVGAVLIGNPPHAWGLGSASSYLTGMALGGVISLGLRLRGTRR